MARKAANKITRTVRRVTLTFDMVVADSDDLQEANRFNQERAEGILLDNINNRVDNVTVTSKIVVDTVKVSDSIAA